MSCAIPFANREAQEEMQQRSPGRNITEKLRKKYNREAQEEI